MIISNWVEKKLEERERKREQALIEQGREIGREEGRKEGIEIGRREGIELERALRRERIAAEAKGKISDDEPPTGAPQ